MVAKVAQPQKADVLGAEFQIKYTKESERFQTTLGGCISCLVFLLIGIAILVVARRFFDTSSPSVTISTKFLPKAPKTNFYEEEIFYVFSFFKNFVGLPPTEIQKYITIRLEVLKYVLSGANIGIEFESIFNYVPCTQLKEKMWLENFRKPGFETIMGYAYGFGVCPDITSADKEKYFAEGKFENPPYNQVRIAVYPCSLQNPADCLPMVGVVSTTLINSKKAFDPANYKNPVTNILELGRGIVYDLSKYKQIKYRSFRSTVMDATSDFFSETERTNFTEFKFYSKTLNIRDPRKVHCTEAEMNLALGGPCHPYASLDFLASSDAQVISRQYTTLLSSIGELGGIVEVFFMFAGLLYVKYNSHKLAGYVRDKLFGKRWETEIVPCLDNDEESSSLLDSSKLISGAKTKDEKKKVEENREMVVELMDDMLEDNEDGIALFEKIHQMRALEAMLFDEHHKVLLPIVLLNIAKQKKAEREKFDANSSNILVHAIKNAEKHMTPEIAYKRLIRSTPDTEVKRAVSEFILKNIPKKFKKMYGGHANTSSLLKDASVISAGLDYDSSAKRLEPISLGGHETRSMKPTYIEPKRVSGKLRLNFFNKGKI